MLRSHCSSLLRSLESLKIPNSTLLFTQLISICLVSLSPSLVLSGDFLLHPYRKPKRIRTAFAPLQLLELENAFEGNQYVVGSERKALAKTLNLTETQVRK